MPLLGTLLRSVGHIPVHFKRADDATNFSTEESKKRQITDMIEEHVGKNGGWICMYPEGQVHRGNGSRETATLQPFRIGGMGMALQYDMELWLWVAKGNNDCWPRNGKGGLPANITATLVPVAPKGSRELLQQLEPSIDATSEWGEELKQGLPKLVAHAQEFMQSELNALYDMEKKVG